MTHPIRLKPLPKGFINQYITDMLNERNLRFTVQDDNGQNQYKVYVSTEDDFEEVTDYITSLVGIKFNRYILNKIGHPTYFYRPLSILRISPDESQRTITFHISKEA